MKKFQDIVQSIMRKNTLGGAAKNQKKMALVQRKTSGLHRQVERHWRFVKYGMVLVSIGIAILAFSFYQQIKKEAFQSTAEVLPIGARNIDAERLFDTLDREYDRAEAFAESVESGPVSFDPARYDIVLRTRSSLENQTGATSSVDGE